MGGGPEVPARDEQGEEYPDEVGYDEKEQHLIMVAIHPKLIIEIDVKNYEQAVKNDRGRFLGTMTKVPGINSFVRGKVDQTIEEEVKKNLEQALPESLTRELTKGLYENGVEASVNVSLSY